MKLFVHKFFLPAVLVFVFSGCKEEEFDYFGSIYGKILASETSTPIAGAQVVLSPGSLSTVTGADGNYEFRDLDAGQYKLSVSAAGYATDTRQISVLSGEKTICDFNLDRNEAFELSSTNLDFGTQYDERTFTIKNIGTAGKLSWTITNITVNWLTVSPMEGSTDAGKSSSVKVIIDRRLITENVSTSFNVEAAGGSQAVKVSVGYDDGSADKPRLELSATELDFGTNLDEMPLQVENAGISEDLVWNISNITVSWLHVNPSEGVTAAGNSTSVKVTIDREEITKDVNTVFSVNAVGGSSKSVNVIVKYKDDEEDLPGGGDGEGDYSSATVKSGDSRIKAELLNCERNGSSVTLTYVLENTGLGLINDFRIYPTDSNSLINGAYRTIITDNNYNNYIESTYTFNGASQSQNYVLSTDFPEGVKCKGTVVIKNFDESATSLTVILGIWAYDLYPDSLADPRIYFRDVPIY